MDGLTKERVQLALRVLSSRYDRTVRITDADVQALKSYFDGDVAGTSLDDMAVAVIHRELDLESMVALAGTA